MASALTLSRPHHAWLEAALFRYPIAVLITLVAYALQALVWPYIPPSPQLLFYPAVFLAAWVGGMGPGVLATVLAALGMAHGFLPPAGKLIVTDAGDMLDLAIFVGVSVAVSFALGRLREGLRTERIAASDARHAKETTDAAWSMVAHDLRTPLSVITLSSRELARHASNPAEIEKALGLIQRSSSRARALIDDAIDAMRFAEGLFRVERAACDVGELCAHAVDAVALLASRKGVKLDLDVSDRTVAVLCDQPRMEQVLTNLLGNALKFTPAGGTVSLYADAEADGTRIKFAVMDTGRGIPKEELSAIFDKFWTGAASRGGGSGLGLWIVCALLEAHGTRLAVESRVGVGTSFTFSLPVADHRSRCE